MPEPETPQHLKDAHGEVSGGGDYQEGQDRSGDELPVGRVLNLDRATPASVLRLFDDDQQRDRGQKRQSAPEQEDRVERPGPVTAAEGVERPCQYRSRDQAPELGARHPTVCAAAVLLGAHVGDQGLRRGRDRRGADPFQEPEEDEPRRLGRGDEEQLSQCEERHTGNDHRLPSDGVAHSAEQRGEGEAPDVVGGRDDPDEPDGGVRLLLQEDGEVGQDGAEPRPHDEAGRADDTQLEPLGPIRATTRAYSGIRHRQARPPILNDLSQKHSCGNFAVM